MRRGVAVFIAIAVCLGIAVLASPHKQSGAPTNQYSLAVYGDQWERARTPVEGPTTEIQPKALWRMGGPDKPQRPVGAAIIGTGMAPLDDYTMSPGTNCSGDGVPDQGVGDIVGHETAVGSITGALDNDFGILGTAPGVTMYTVRVMRNDDQTISKEALECALRWVLENYNKVTPQIEVINLSLGGRTEPTKRSDDGNCGYTDGDVVHQLVCQLRDARVAIVAAAGNSGEDASLYTPGGYPEVLTVSGFTDSDAKPGGLGPIPHNIQDGVTPQLFADDHFAFFSNHGRLIDITAPAVADEALQFDGTPVYVDGTSFAAPYLTGIYANEVSRYGMGELTVEEVFARLTDRVEANPVAGEPNTVDQLHHEGLATMFDLAA